MERTHYLDDATTTVLCTGQQLGRWTERRPLVTCPDCWLRMSGHHEANAYTADTFRRAEVDAWLKEIGATTIRVTDLGAALWTYERGLRGETFVRTGPNDNQGVIYETGWSSRQAANRQTHLARVALGDAL